MKFLEKIKGYFKKEEIPEVARFKDFIWYAKRHYGEYPYDDLIDKLKIVQSHVCGTPIEYCYEKDILDILQIIIRENYNEWQYSRLLEDLIERMCFPFDENRKIENVKDMIYFLLIRIELLRVRDNEKVLVNMGEKDTELEEKIRKYEVEGD
ncbi:MAG: hypothetical protein K9K32_04600 [Halanaerobiales bacterium]|nr:hypothetical protein [Halanaerobiales bacterium]